MSKGCLKTVLTLLALCVASGPAGAQQPGLQRPVQLPTPQTAPVVPDTVDIVISAPDTLPRPLLVQVVQDTLQFGGLLNLVLDYGTDQTDGPQLQLKAEGDWLVAYAQPRRGLMARLLGRKASPPLALSALPASKGLRVVRSFRVYRRDPFRIQWRDYLSPVLTVVGQAEGTEQMAAIRDPRALRWTPWRLLVLVVILLALAILGRWWWLRRQAPVPLAHWSISAPPWLDFALGLQSLWADNTLARGDARLFLDQLAALARSYVAGRYRVPAREMTGSEIVRACAALGHEPANPHAFARFIDLADKERYNPQPPEPSFCREQAVQLLGRVHRVRLDTRYASVKPEHLLAAQKAWADLVAELGLRAERSRATVKGEVQ